MFTLKQVIDKVASRILAKDFSTQAQMVLKRATAKVLTQLKGNLDNQLKSGAKSVVETFIKNVTGRLKDRTNLWFDQSGQLTVVPDGTRLALGDKTVSILVVEQSPQVRTITIRDNDDITSKRRLAFPYVVFILKFVEGNWTSLQVGMRKKPLESLDDFLFYPIVPNHEGHHKICLGHFKPQRGTISDVTRQVIGSFWQSCFDINGNAHYIEFLESNGLRYVDRWEEKSKVNPLFVLEENTKYNTGTQLRKLTALDQGQDAASLVNLLQKDIDESVSILRVHVQNTLNADFTKENLDAPHADTLQEILKEIIIQSYAELHEFMHKEMEEQLNKEREKLVAKFKTLADSFPRSVSELQ